MTLSPLRMGTAGLNARSHWFIQTSSDSRLQLGAGWRGTVACVAGLGYEQSVFNQRPESRASGANSSRKEQRCRVTEVSTIVIGTNACCISAATHHRSLSWTGSWLEPWFCLQRAGCFGSCRAPAASSSSNLFLCGSGGSATHRVSKLGHPLLNILSLNRPSLSIGAAPTKTIVSRNTDHPVTILIAKGKAALCAPSSRLETPDHRLASAARPAARLIS
ncbi:hypothetical protein N658DRAFT_194014 [Parathielavia hyrcaniae]|uniref:Uncharacterized protein n=1 Tax=Parathielavia hyrcaniae TaxID=113614 RepID=A0AAN6Q780_9PEZI|nr:hypothetical protein N658DRAFT_194014 [Parathielavia hyrcaniae]